MEEAIDLGDKLVTYIKTRTEAANIDLSDPSPEQELYIAVVERAARDLRNCESWIKKDAAEWILAPEEIPVSFQFIVTQLQLGSKIISALTDAANKTLASMPVDEIKEAGSIQRRYMAYWRQETKLAREAADATIVQRMRNGLVRVYIRRAALTLLSSQATKNQL